MANNKSNVKSVEESAHRKGIVLREWLIVALTISSLLFSGLIALSNSNDAKRILEVSESQAESAKIQATASKTMADVTSRQEAVATEQKMAMQELARLGAKQSQSAEEQARAMLASSQYQKSTSIGQGRLISESRRANSLSSDSVYQQNRPWISVSNIAIKPNNDKKLYHLQYTIQNFGRTPGIEVRTNIIHSFNVIVNGKDKITQPGSCDISLCQKSAVFPNQTIQANYFVGFDVLNTDALEKIKLGSRFYINIIIEYADNFGYSHFTRNCTFYEYDFSVSKPCSFGNEIT